jgi:uncharacterized protein
MTREDRVPVADEVPGDWLAGQVARYRDTRERIERGALPLATSVDGRAFELQASLHGLRLRRGGYVVLESESGTRLGQITELAQHSVTTEVEDSAVSRSQILVRLAVGHGLLLAEGEPFHDALVRPAEPDEVARWVARVRPARAVLDVGELLLAPGVPAELDSGGLSRHTFLCGQSGSGKTYSLGLLLERVLSETHLRIVVLDPNSDHVGLGRLRPDADAGRSRRYAEVAADVAVWSAQSGDLPLRLRFDELDARAQGAVLGLDPVQDVDAYDALVDLLDGPADGGSLVDGLAALLDSPSAGVRQLGMRARNLGVADWSVWTPSDRSLLEELAAPTARCIVVDLGSLATLPEQRLVADAVLAALWRRRHSRDPVLVVIDEAHNVCAADPSDPVSGISTERAVQMAAEGRKYGLYMLVSTQRPGKVHENVVSQCDNLVLMRMNGAFDVRELERLFSFVPPGLMAGATTFGMGQALVSGRLFPTGSCYVQMGDRLSQEGGADIPLTWAQPPVPVRSPSPRST